MGFTKEDVKYKGQNFIQKFFDWKVPYALPGRFCLSSSEGEDEDNYTWEDWEEEMMSKFPVKYFMLETIPDWFSSNISWINNTYYKIKSRFWTKHHLLDLRNEQENYTYGYMDQSEQIFFACMKCLADFIEKEFDSLDEYQAHIEGNKFNGGDEPLQKALDIYKWWKNYKQTYDYSPLYQALESSRTAKERKTCLKTITAIEKKKQQDIEDNLRELMRIRPCLWT